MVVSFLKKLFGFKPESVNKLLPQTEVVQEVHADHPANDRYSSMVGVYMPLPFYVNFKDIPSVRKPKNCSDEISELHKNANECRRKCIKLSNVPLIHGRFMDLDNFGRLSHDDMVFVFKCNGRCANLFYYINEWAMSLIKIKKVVIAQSVLERAIELKTDTPKSYELLGNIYFKQKNTDELKRLYEQLSKIEVPGAARNRVLENLNRQISKAN